eukprot:13713009-Alexandrium_andersonii.AAC.1
MPVQVPEDPFARTCARFLCLRTRADVCVCAQQTSAMCALICHWPKFSFQGTSLAPGLLTLAPLPCNDGEARTVGLAKPILLDRPHALLDVFS